jgi:hypothetical protein
MFLFRKEYIIFILKGTGRNAVDRINLAMDREGWHARGYVKRTQVP